jgi:hypothetical protein
MRKYVLCLLVVTLFLAGCTVSSVDDKLIRSSGKMASRDYTLDGFTKLDINSAFEVKVSRGDAFKVTVTADENVIEYVKVAKEGATLVVAIEAPGLRWFGSTRQEATVTMPDLEAVQVNGASKLDMTGFGSVDQFEAGVDGASRLTGDLQAGTMRLVCNGASRIELSGSGTDLTLDVNGASRADLGDLEVKTADVTLNGASTATVDVSGSLDYDLNGASTLRYQGDPEIGKSRTEGASRATRQ